MSLTPGTTLGPYEIQSALGAGGMGEVYRSYLLHGHSGMLCASSRHSGGKGRLRVYSGDRVRFSRVAASRRPGPRVEGAGTTPHISHLIARYFMEHLPAGER